MSAWSDDPIGHWTAQCGPRVPFSRNEPGGALERARNQILLDDANCGTRHNNQMGTKYIYTDSDATKSDLSH